MTGVSARRRFPPRAAPDAAAYLQEGAASRLHPHRARFLVGRRCQVLARRLLSAGATVPPAPDTGEPDTEAPDTEGP